MKAIELEDVSVEFEDAGETVHAVRDVTLKVEPGSLVWLGGPSGSGKSTLLSVISGLLRPSSGSAIVAGVDIGTASQNELAALRLEHVGVVFQENNLIQEFNALENIELPLRARGIGPKEAEALALSALTSVGLDGLGRRKPNKLSGGQRQRVGIARALVGGRSILVADEPTGSLDSVTSRSIFETLRNIAKGDVIVMVASHDREAEKYADRILTISDGKVLESLEALGR